MKNKKLISLVAALAMIFSMFSAFTVVNADNTKGMKLEGALSADGTEISVTVKAVGIEKPLASAGIAFAVPDGVTAEDITVAKGIAFGKPNLTKAGILKLAYLDTEGDGATVPADGILAKITIKLAAPLSADYALTLDGAASIQEKGEEELTVADANMVAENTTVAKWVDPNKKPDTVSRPSQEVEPVKPDVPKPVAPVGQGIALEASLDKTNTVLTVVAKAAGITKPLASAGIAFAVPDGVTAEDITVAKGIAFGKPNLTKAGILKLAYLDTEGDGATVPADGILATITINLGTPVTAPVVVTLDGAASIQEKGEEELTVADGMTAASAVAALYEGEAPKPVKTVDLKDYVGAGYEEAIAAVPAGKAVYLTVAVKKGDEDAAYGADFDVEYPAGTKLSEAEFKNIIHGYTDDDMTDVIKGMKFNIYNTAVNKIATTLNAEDQETQLVFPVDKEITAGGKPTDKSADGKIAPAKTSKSIKTDAGKQSLTLTVTPAKDKDGVALTEGSVKIVVDADTFDAITASGVQVAYTDAEGAKQTVKLLDETETALGAANDNKYVVTFTPAAKGTVSYTVTYTDANGKDTTAVATYKITKADTPGNNGGSDNKSSGNGAIASGIVPTTGTSPLFATFSDLGDADWARTAITALALKNYISGRGDGTFDPNGNITRAEYAQILVNAIGKANESADAQFNDVATDAWYYHNVAVAAQYGIVSGFEDGSFRPYELITREQMALMTMKAAQAANVNLAGSTVGQFTDGASISDWANEAVYTLANAGIINGMGDGTFAPKNNATRAQAATIIYNAFVK